MKRYEDLSDETIISGIRAGDTPGVDFLLEKYKNLVRKKARALYLIVVVTANQVERPRFFTH